MKIADLYIIRSRSYHSNLEKSELEKELINGFNLNRKRTFKSIQKKELNEYTGSLNSKSFIIKQNNTLISTNDGNYFFSTQITGEISDNGTERVMTINAELSKGIIGLILGSSPIYLLILIFGNLWLGIQCFLFLIFMYWWGIKRVKSDFQVFEKHLKQKVTVYNTVYN